MTFRNIANGETMQVGNITMLQGRIFFSVRGKGCGTRFFNRNICLKLDEQAENGTWLKIADGWEIVPNTRTRKSRQSSVTEPTNEPTTNPVSVAVVNKFDRYRDIKKEHPDVIPLFRCGDFYETYGKDADIVGSVCDLIVTLVNGESLTGFPHHALDTYLPKLIRAGHRVCICDEKQAEPTAEPTPTAKATTDKDNSEKLLAEMHAKYGNMGKDILAAILGIVGGIDVKAAVNRDEVISIIDEHFKSVKAQPMQLQVVTPRGTNTINGTVNKDFAKFCNIVQTGKPLYMYGPAGCGKSYTAKQIAEALGLDYYETSQAMFAHDLKGYGDAAGRYVDTAFYKAFSKGGVFFLDEVDASAPEALVVMNNAIANKRFDFPVVGNIEAHPDFRVIAAGNTRMTGATIEYTARQMQDTSFKNRFFFATVTYDRDVFLQVCGGDAEIVNFGADLRSAARETGITQLFSYRQGADLAQLVECCEGDDAYLLRGSVLQEKELDDVQNLYAALQDKSNRWAKAMAKVIEDMKTEEVW